jgi:hypothetical protein
LHYPVAHRRYPQGPQLPMRLRNVHALHRLRLVGLRTQRFPNSFRKSRRALVRPHGLFDRDAVHPRRSLVPPHPFSSRFQHIHSKDPVVQHLKLDLRFLLGLSAQLPSPLRSLLRQSWLFHRLRHRLSCGCPSFRSGTLIQAGFSSSCRFRLPARPLRSHPVGPPRLLDRPFPARCPQPPWKARRLRAPVASPPVAGFILAGGLATFVFRSRPNRVHLRYGSRVRLPSPLAPSLEPSLVRLHAEPAIYTLNSFQFTRSARLILVTD